MNSHREKGGSWALKFCVLGDGGVGKTTLVERLATGNFNPITKMTIGIDFSLMHLDIQLDSGEYANAQVTIWDLGGEDRFRIMLPSYIQGADGGILLYDVTRFTSAMALPSWIDMWRKNTPPDTPIFLVGSKFDLVKESMYTMVQNNVRTLKEELGVKIHFLISTKEGIMLNDLMQTITKEMITFKSRTKTTQGAYSLENILKA